MSVPEIHMYDVTMIHLYSDCAVITIVEFSEMMEKQKLCEYNSD